ncbi:Protein Bel-1 [Trichinella pseudospiralis]
MYTLGDLFSVRKFPTRKFNRTVKIVLFYHCLFCITVAHESFPLSFTIILLIWPRCWCILPKPKKIHSSAL